MICKRIAQDYSEYLSACRGIYFTINLTAEDLQDKSFPSFVDALFNAHGLSRRDVTFEITEKHSYDYGEIIEQLITLKGLGFKIALDDFGTGYSGLESFERLPIDIVKLDRSFFSNDHKKYNPAWKQIFKMISDFDVDFIAEGIETHTEHSGIKSQNVRYAQGWFYSKALGAKEFTRQFLFKVQPTNKTFIKNIKHERFDSKVLIPIRFDNAALCATI